MAVSSPGFSLPPCENLAKHTLGNHFFRGYELPLYLSVSVVKPTATVASKLLTIKDQMSDSFLFSGRQVSSHLHCRNVYLYVIHKQTHVECIPVAFTYSSWWCGLWSIETLLIISCRHCPLWMFCFNWRLGKALQRGLVRCFPPTRRPSQCCGPVIDRYCCFSQSWSTAVLILTSIHLSREPMKVLRGCIL